MLLYYFIINCNKIFKIIDRCLKVCRKQIINNNNDDAFNFDHRMFVIHTNKKFSIKSITSLVVITLGEKRVSCKNSDSYLIIS